MKCASSKTNLRTGDWNPFTFHLNLFHSLQDVALCLSASCAFPFSELSFSCSDGPTIALHSRYVTCPSPLYFHDVFYYISYCCSPSDEVLRSGTCVNGYLSTCHWCEILHCSVLKHVYVYDTLTDSAVRVS